MEEEGGGWDLDAERGEREGRKEEGRVWKREGEGGREEYGRKRGELS